MIAKLAFVILLAVAVLGLAGRVLPRRRKGPAPRPIQALRKCPRCGTWGQPGEPCAAPGCKG